MLAVVDFSECIVARTYTIDPCLGLIPAVRIFYIKETRLDEVYLLSYIREDRFNQLVVPFSRSPRDQVRYKKIFTFFRWRSKGHGSCRR